MQNAASEKKTKMTNSSITYQVHYIRRQKAYVKQQMNIRKIPYDSVFQYYCIAEQQTFTNIDNTQQNLYAHWADNAKAE